MDPSPIFVLGHWRSGTTTLQRFLCAHSGTAYLQQAQSFFPLGWTIHGKVTGSLLDGIFKLFQLRHPSHRIPMTSNFPSEDDILFCMSGCTWSPMWAHIHTRHAVHFFKENLVLRYNANAHKNFMQDYIYFVKRLSFLNGNKKLILKSPANTCRIPELISLFPEARFIYVERNPEEVFKSTMKLLQNNSVQWLYTMSYDQKLELYSYGFETLLNEYNTMKMRIPKTQLLELNLMELKHNPEVVQDKIYNFLNWEIVESKKRQYLELLGGEFPELPISSTDQSELSAVKMTEVH
jgi:hypothetical protein